MQPTQEDLEYLCSNEVQEIIAQTGSLRLGTAVTKIVSALLEARRDLVEACEIADRHIFVPDPNASVGSEFQNGIVTIESGKWWATVYGDKARVAELLETYKK
jgi:hypothetical protein